MRLAAVALKLNCGENVITVRILTEAQTNLGYFDSKKMG
jgi:hypothetical protein